MTIINWFLSFDLIGQIGLVFLFLILAKIISKKIKSAI